MAADDYAPPLSVAGAAFDANLIQSSMREAQYRQTELARLRVVNSLLVAALTVIENTTDDPISAGICRDTLAGAGIVR